VITDPKTYRYSGGGERVPLALRGNFFFIPAAIEMPGRTQLEGQFVVDTGAGLTMILTTAFARSKNLPAPVQKILVDRSDAGLGGETSMIVSRAASMSFGNLVILEPIVYVSQDAAGALATSEYDGVIGGGILRRFKVIFDYARQQLILEPNAGSDEPIEYDMSGMRLHTEGDQFGTFRIHQVLEHTPAARAGLRKGDELITIDGAPATKFSLDEIDDMLRRPGKKHKLGFKRSRKTFSVTIRLERLI
jgi:S1-C subfamily serine protease